MAPWLFLTILLGFPLLELWLAVLIAHKVGWWLLLWLIGAAIFGVGWGLCGVCPGPAIAGLGTGNLSLLWALGGIAVGALAQGLCAKYLH